MRGELCCIALVMRSQALKRLASAQAQVNLSQLRHRRPADHPSLAHVVSRLNADGAMLQPYLPEISSRGEVSVILINGVFSHSVLKVPADGDFRVQQRAGGTVSTHPDVSTSLIDLAQRAITVAPEPPLYARVDIVDTELYGPVIMELELIEPELFNDTYVGTHTILADAVCALRT